MMTNTRRVAVVLAAVAAGFATAANAASLEALQGAWTMDGTGCDDTFEKVGSDIRFKDRTSTLTTGILVKGDKILGSNLSCTAEKVREEAEKGTYSVMLNCADALMFQTVSTTFKVTGPDSFQRFDPGFPDISFAYQRCKL